MPSRLSILVDRQKYERNMRKAAPKHAAMAGSRPGFRNAGKQKPLIARKGEARPRQDGELTHALG